MCGLIGHSLVFSLILTANEIGKLAERTAASCQIVGKGVHDMILPLSYGEYIGLREEPDPYCIGAPQSGMVLKVEMT